MGLRFPLFAGNEWPSGKRTAYPHPQAPFVLFFKNTCFYMLLHPPPPIAPQQQKDTCHSGHSPERPWSSRVFASTTKSLSAPEKDREELAPSHRERDGGPGG